MTLLGMTWDHPRGFDPLIACSNVWRERTGVRIEWDRRSLQDFEAYPVQELAARYDLIVIDHPHIGDAARSGCLASWPDADRDHAGFVGPSWSSYVLNGYAYARPIDAACQVAARAETLAEAPAGWDEVIVLAEEGRVAWPLRPPHAILSFCTIAGTLGLPVAREENFVSPQDAERILDIMQQVVARVDPSMDSRDPISVLEDMASGSSHFIYAPVIFGYVSYARAGFRPVRLRFSDPIATGLAGVRGSVIGGTGMAVSSLRPDTDLARAFAEWASGAEAQGIAAASGGQPAARVVWDDEEQNRGAADFYRTTRVTIETSWIRPRHDRFIAFQHEASLIVLDALRGRASVAAAVRAINDIYAASLRT